MGPDGEEQIPLEEFFVAAGKTVLGNNKILAEIRVPRIPLSTKAIYLKHGIRQAMEIAQVCVAVALDIDPDTHICNQARIAMGSVAPTPLRSPNAERVLIGNRLDDDLIEKAVSGATMDANPRGSSRRTSREYKLEILKVLIERGVKEILTRSSKDG